MDYAEIVDADVRELRATGDLADRPHSWRGGLQPLVDLDVSPVGELDAGQFQAKSFGVWSAACGDQYICLFTDPELARIGLSETEAEAQGIAYLFKVPMETNLRAHTLSETRGFVKALVEADSDRILGFTAFAVGAGEILAAVQVAMIAGLPYTALRDAVLTHPTLAEGLISLFSSAASAHHVVETRGAQISAA